MKTSWRRAAGMIIILLISQLALLAPFYAPASSAFSPFVTNLGGCNLPPGASAHLLGTDHLGRDELALAAWGARTSLLVGLSSAIAAVMLGATWGALSAFAGGLIEATLMRVIDVLLAVPGIMLLLIARALVSDVPYRQMMPAPLLHALGINSYSDGLLPVITVILVIASTTWLETARVTRARVQSLKSEEFIEAAKSVGLSTWGIVLKHLLPNAANIIFLEGTLLVSDAILIEAGLSYLGLGLGPSMPSWGSMLNSAQANLLANNWSSVLVPGTLISLTVLSVQLVTQSAKSKATLY
jgi:peptide/nickel transport system permease protein